MSGTLGPRIVVAGTHSGVGKTTVATGVMAALHRRGDRVAGAKVGPDFIDPGYHALACGRPPRNLDPWMCGPEAVVPLAGRAGQGADVLVVEGVMGLFDGAADGASSSTADVARLLEAPVVLVVDAAAQSGSVAALVHGFATFDPALALVGVVLNRVGSDTHETQLREALEPLGVPVLGALRRDDRLAWRDRHLGLVPVAEHPDSVRRSLDALADAVAEGLDLDALVGHARTAPAVPAGAVPLPRPPAGPAVRVAVAAGRAFTFTYTDTTEALVAAGAEVVPFDPAADEDLPPGTSGLVVGGGFPEVYVSDLGANTRLMDRVRGRAGRDLVVWAECGGLLWLGASLDGTPMVGALPVRARMTGRLTLGYRRATLDSDCPVGRAGSVMRGHEFHYSETDPAGDALELESRWSRRREGFAGPRLLATYLHHHPGGDPGPVGRFVAACREAAGDYALHQYPT